MYNIVKYGWIHICFGLLSVYHNRTKVSKRLHEETDRLTGYDFVGIIILNLEFQIMTSIDDKYSHFWIKHIVFD